MVVHVPTVTVCCFKNSGFVFAFFYRKTNIKRCLVVINQVIVEKSVREIRKCGMKWMNLVQPFNFSYLFIANLTQGSIDYFKFFVQSMCKLAVLNSISFGLVTNSWDVLTYLEVWINEFIKQIFQVANWKKNCFGTIRNAFFFELLRLRKICGIN